MKTKKTLSLILIIGIGMLLYFVVGYATDYFIVNSSVMNKELSSHIEYMTHNESVDDDLQIDYKLQSQELEDDLYALSLSVADYFNKKYELDLKTTKYPAYICKLDEEQFGKAEAFYDSGSKSYYINKNRVENTTLNPTNEKFIVFIHEIIHMLYDYNNITQFPRFTYQKENQMLEIFFTEACTEKAAWEYLDEMGIEYDKYSSQYVPMVYVRNMIERIIDTHLTKDYLTNDFENVRTKFNAKFAENSTKTSNVEPLEFVLYSGSEMSISYFTATEQTFHIPQYFSRATFSTLFTAASNLTHEQKEEILNEYDEFSQNYWIAVDRSDRKFLNNILF